MYPEFLQYLRCPESGEELQLEATQREGERIVAGTLFSSRARYPIIRGVPHFVGAETANYAASFGYQWARWPRVQFESENAGRPMAGHTASMFQRIVAQPADRLREGVVLDVGCGAGRFIDVLRSQGNARVIGVDYSAAANVAAENFRSDRNVLIVRADALRLPIRPGSLDGAYSIGVLHHTPDPRRGFQQLVAAVREGGWVAVCVYGKGGFYDDPRVLVYRRLFKLLWPLFGNLAPLAYSQLVARAIYPLTKVPVLGPLMRLLFPMARLPDVRWRVLDTFDAVTPSYQSTHESYEIFQWFRQEALAEIEPSDWGFTSYHARVARHAR
jgi:SAM-dependent methyltransferase